MEHSPRWIGSVLLVVAAWGLFLASPFMFLGEEALLDYWQGLVSAALLWVPLTIATVVTFAARRIFGIVAAAIVMAIPFLMIVTYGSGIGLIWLAVGACIVLANLVRANEGPSVKPV